MRNEDERSLNVMRGLLLACEEGANEELNDGSDGNEPWTEEDRRASRATAEWLRSTFFAAPAAQHASKPKIRKLAGKQLFTDEELWTQLESDDSERRRLAVDAIDALANLAAVRARKRGTHFLVERHAVFDVALLKRDLRGQDRELYDAAFRVWDEVSHLAALVESENVELTDEERQEARELHEWTLAKLAELDRAAKEREEKDGAS